MIATVIEKIFDRIWVFIARARVGSHRGTARGGHRVGRRVRDAVTFAVATPFEGVLKTEQVA
jgi:hypothetical protein